jgi:F-type H+-transporting ATPase subunit epsilon
VAGELQVELVAADRKVWSGQASIVITRTTEGDIGIMPGHQPLLGLLVSGHDPHARRRSR